MTPPSFWHIWLSAARPRTLPAAAAPVLVGMAVAAYEGFFNLGPALAALVGALLIQIGTNFANDVFDFQKGADTSDRLGPTRATQAGWVTPQHMLAATALTFGLAVLVGVYLVWVGGWPIVVIGVLSIVCGLAYTGGPFPLGYNGLGDLFVFIFFGLVAVMGTYYVQAGVVSALAVWAAIPIGLLATAIIVVNNLRDVDTDRKAGKRTLAVRFGVDWVRAEYRLLLVTAYMAPVAAWLSGQAPAGALLAWLSLPLAVRLIRAVYTQTGKALNPVLGGTGQLELVYAGLYALGLLVSGLWA